MIGISHRSRVGPGESLMNLLYERLGSEVHVQTSVQSINRYMNIEKRNICYKCGRQGHIRYDCPFSKKQWDTFRLPLHQDANAENKRASSTGGNKVSDAACIVQKKLKRRTIARILDDIVGVVCREAGE